MTVFELFFPLLTNHGHYNGNFSEAILYLRQDVKFVPQERQLTDGSTRVR